MKQFKNLLFVVEGDESDQATALARALSLAENNQASLTLLRVLERPRLGPLFGKGYEAEIEARLRQRELDRIESLLAAHAERSAIMLEVRFGTPFIEIVRDVLRNGRDLVIKRAQPTGIGSALFGGTDRHLLRKCPCPVWLMQADERANYAKIVAAIDFDPWQPDDGENSLNRLILELSSSLALSDFAELHLVHAWEPVADTVVRVFGSDLSDEDIMGNLAEERKAHQAQLERTADALRARLGDEAYAYLTPHLHLRQGSPRMVIPELVGELEADLLVMGTLSRGGVSGFLIGNTAEAILGSIRCSVLTLKPEGFVTPIELDG